MSCFTQFTSDHLPPMHRKPASAAQRTPDWLSLPHLLTERARLHPDRPALTFIDGDGPTPSLTYAELHDRVIELTQRIEGVMGSRRPTASQERAVEESQFAAAADRALLLFPPGLEFIVGFFACQYCRLIPVPTCFPKPGRAMPRLESAAADCAPALLLADAETLAGLDPARLSHAVTSPPHLATDAVQPGPIAGNAAALLDRIEPTDLGLLQYTSGSTSDPKGVMVSHANLLTNLESICDAFGLHRSRSADDHSISAVSWLPPFHDMGLIGGLLEAIYLGGHTTLMSPRSFLSKPSRWLATIASTGATISGAPNFAFELCVDRMTADEAAELDLSRWEVAFCGAEPIAVETLDRFANHFAAAGFRSNAYIPCYGLAEATLLVASSRSNHSAPRLKIDRDELTMGRATPVGDDHPRNQTRTIACCGEPCLDTRIEIVCPDGRPCLDGQIGEIWLQGGSIAQGYWQRDDINAERFGARIANDAAAGEFLRTGDLGFFHDGNLYVTGRCKDLIILRGRNHFPQDIEATVQRALGDQMTRCVAVATNAYVGEALSIVAEVSRHTDEDSLPSLVRHIRRQVIDEHEIDARQIVLTRPGAIPVTTSGKVKRAACRQLLESDEIPARYEWSRSILADQGTSDQLPPLPQHVDESSRGEATQQIEAWMLAWLIHRSGMDAKDVCRDTRFTEHGLDSMSAVELSGELDDWLGVELTPVVAETYPTPAKLAAYLAGELVESTPH
ncbi:AMP-binding protein [Allorhodopirellula solitaria]|nr:AMP-binding protein [Allorhodopirellula solitaria]